MKQFNLLLIFLILLTTLSPLKADNLFTWGNNGYGQLGDGTTTEKFSPVQICINTNWSQVVCGENHILAIKSDGTLWAWGKNGNGELGDGTTTNRIIPVQIGNSTNWFNLFLGASCTFAIKTDGTLWAWGYNAYGQLGDGTTTDKTSPIQIGTENNWTKIACGRDHTIAIKNDGTLWAWGHNFSGQLGDGTSLDKHSPIQIGIETNWFQVTCGQIHTIAIKNDGTLWAWGGNGGGYLGDGTTIIRYSPVQIGSGTNWSQLAFTNSFNIHTEAIKSDGTLWAWGGNWKGQIGDGTTTDRHSPIQIGNETNWSQIFCGYCHTIAIKTDGTLWAWGYNLYGQLGDGTTINRYSPVQIGTRTNWSLCTAGDIFSAALESYCDSLIIASTSLNFGDRTCLPDTTITINLNNPMDLSVNVSQTIFAKGSESKLSVTNGGAFTISRNDSKQLSINIKPSSTGIIDDTLYIFLPIGCVSRREIPISGFRDTLDFAFFVPDTFNIGRTCPNIPLDTIIKVKNKSSKATSFIRNNIDNPFTLTGNDPFASIFALNETKDLHLSFISPDTGIFYQKLIITDTCGKTKKIVLKAEIHVPQADAGLDQTICAGDTINIGNTATGGTPPFRYSWDPGTGLSKTNSAITQASPIYNTLYYVYVTDKIGCTSMDSIYITVNPALVVNIDENISICVDSSYTLNPTINAGTEPYIKFQWTPSAGLSDPNVLNPVVRNTTPGIYKYFLTVTDANGCKGIDSINVTVRPQSELALSKETMDFGTLDPCQSSKEDSLEISNSGMDDIIIDKCVTNSGFSLVSPVFPLVLKPGEKRTIIIRYTATSIGTVSGQIILIGTPCNWTKVFQCKANKSEMLLSSDLAGMDFGQSLKCVPITKDSILVLTNTGSSDISVYFENIVLNAPFTLVDPKTTRVISPKDTLQVLVHYQPITTGSYSEDIKIPFEAGTCKDTLKIALLGKIVEPKISFDKKNIFFPDILGCDNSRDTTITIQNTGTIDVTFSGIEPADVFSTTSNFNTILAGEKQDITIRFFPKNTGTYKGNLIIKFEPCGISDTINVSGNKQGVVFNVIDSLDFGEIVVCNDISKTLQLNIDNLSSGGLTGLIKSLVNVSASFSTTIKPGDSLYNGVPNLFDISANINSSMPDGEITGTLDFILSPCDSIKSIKLRAKKTSVTLTSPTVLNFGQVNIGISKIDSIIIKNSGTSETEINTIDNIVLPFELISTTPKLPATLKPNEELVARISYIPNDELNDTLTALLKAEPCSITNEMVLIGIASISSDSVLLHSGNTEGYPGDIVEVPIILNNHKSLEASGITGLKTDLSFNSTLLLPLDIATKKIDVTTSKIILDSLLLKNAVGDTLTKVRFKVGLGNSDFCDLTLSNVETLGGSADISIQNGKFMLLGVCPEGGKRLINPNGKIQITSVKPNPAEDKIEVEVELLELSGYKLSIMNSNGQSVREISCTNNNFGTNSINIDISNLSSGVYSLILQTESERITKMFLILK